MCGDMIREPATQEQLRQSVAQLADEQLLRDFKRILATPAWAAIKSQSMYKGLHDIQILSDVVTTQALEAVGLYEAKRLVIFCADEFGQGGRNASLE
jgi:hypothetical protein